MCTLAAMSAPYLLEKLPHIPQLQLYVNAPAARTALSVREQSITLRISPDTATIHIPLDCRVRMAPPPASSATGVADAPPAPASLSISKAADACLIRIGLHRAYTDATSTLSPSLPSAAEMQPASYRALYCRRCLSPLLAQPPQRVLPLPSSHWSELTDLWYCHNTNDNSHLDALIQHAVRAKQHTLLLGREEVRLNSGAVAGVRVGEAVVREEKRERTKQQHCGHAHHAQHVHDETKEERKEHEQSTAELHSSEQRAVPLASLLYRQACCGQCDAALGWSVTRASEETGESEVWLHKHRITNTLQDDADTTSSTHSEHPLLSALSTLSVAPAADAPSGVSIGTPPTTAAAATSIPSLFTQHYTVETFLSSQLLSLCEARCSFRFIVRPLSAALSGSARHLHLVVLNVDSAIACPSTAQASERGEMQPVLKVAYSACEAEGAQCKGEVVELSAADMAEVEVVLQRQSERLPAEYRRMDKQTLSYLRRLTCD